MSTTIDIPQRSVFRAQEVCEIADVQPYVLRTWEAEFSDLGMAKGDGPRIYRRGDVERVLRIKHLLFVDGLTMAGVRRRLSEEAPAPEPEAAVEEEWAEVIDGALRERLRDVRGGLQSILSILAGNSKAGRDQGGEFRLRAEVTNGGKSHGSRVKSTTPGKKSAPGLKGGAGARTKPTLPFKAAARPKPKASSKAKPAAAKARPKTRRQTGAKKR